MNGPRPTLERVWLAYLACVVPIALLVPGGGHAGHAPWTFVAVHGVVFAAVLWVRWLAVHRSPAAARIPRSLLACAGLPTVFSALCWLLPAVHPEPFEFTLAVADRALFGGDVARWGHDLPPWAVEVMQWTYAGFYFFALAAAVGAGLGRGRAAYDRAVLLLVGGFLCSYLGYLLVPTLGPKVVLAYANDVQGTWATAALRASIDAGESNPWDCFPSGHTMLTVTSLLILWRWQRRWFWIALVPASSLIASTMLLRYHWGLDVLAGAALAWPVARACDRLADRDGWPAVPAGPR